MHVETLNLRDELRKYGLNSGSIRLFGDSASPELLDYLDLVEQRGRDGRKELLPHGVVESQGRPLLFFVNENRLSLTPEEKKAEFGHLRRILACRGDRAYLARVCLGELLVTPVSLTDRTPDWRSYHAGTGEALTFFSRLALGHFDGKGEPDDADFVFKEMFKLLNQGANQLAKILGGRANALSLIGRALFFRFLCDRHIVTEPDTLRIAPQASELLACFDNAENAHATSQWLDQTFNGDFLPLEDGGNRAFFDSMEKRSNSVFAHLRAIVRGLAPVGPGDYQTRLKLKWCDFDFAHVPVGLLSQVYEAFCWKWEHDNAKETSVYYTPRRIAAMLVDEAFDGLPKAHEARVLDPACGAGLFLTLAFRRLYRERWKTKRPGTKAIREILEKQLIGFDISDSALKLTALSLYLTAIELDPKPIPPENLRFNALNNLVLFNHRRPNVDPDDGPVIGSLAAHVGKRFDGEFDLVLSNPPWTSLSKEHKPLAAELTTISKAIIERKGEAVLARDYQNPDNAPDLPFLWKSTEWCKHGGRIAMALPARILFKQEDIPRRARETIFRLIEVTGIINGSNLSDTEVWPKMAQPFMLLFARNRRPEAGHVISLITPYCDKVLNRKGEVRMDSKAAQPIEMAATFEEPWLWKALAVGTPLDVEVTRKIKGSAGKALSRYWENDLKLASGKGYQVVAESELQRPADFLRNLPNLDSTNAFRFVVRPEELKLFELDTVCWPRQEAIYEAPLALIKEGLSIDRKHGRALLSFEKIAYNESFCGYSGAGHPDGELLVRYLHLFVHSLIWIHYVLLTSAKFGAERRRVYKSDLDDCPIIGLDQLSMKQKDTIQALSKRLIDGDEEVFPHIDDFFGSLYGLDKLDMEVIRDTLLVSQPFDKSRERACRPPKGEEIEAFRQRLELVLRPFFKVLGKDVQVIVYKPDDTFLQKEAPFGIVLVGKRGRATAQPDALFRDVILQLADDTGTTRIIQYLECGLLVGILRQYRYWSPSRARLLSAEIVRQHMGVFEE
ncbi:MAG: N-6 DNA methylase [Chloroflexi bacterium]|nr:N-6 DNA methylase [Chloroflexota bacterium]